MRKYCYRAYKGTNRFLVKATVSKNRANRTTFTKTNDQRNDGLRLSLFACSFVILSTHGLKTKLFTSLSSRPFFFVTKLVCVNLRQRGLKFCEFSRNGKTCGGN